jgi:hypothetical protein
MILDNNVATCFYFNAFNFLTIHGESEIGATKKCTIGELPV